MKEIKKELEWDKNITIGLSLKELQLIFDSIKISSYNDIQDICKHYHNNKIPYDMTFIDTICYDIKKILQENGGITEYDTI